MSSGSSSSSLSSSIATGDISIVLTPEFQRDFVLNHNTGFRIKITASDGVNIDDAVFRYYLKTPNPITGIADAVFSGVCTWSDMEDLPFAVPEEGSDPQSFRQAVIDLVVDSESIATDVWHRVLQEVQELVNTIYDGQTLEQGDPVEISSLEISLRGTPAQLSAVGDVA
jgi:hypothetical protein